MEAPSPSRFEDDMQARIKFYFAEAWTRLSQSQSISDHLNEDSTIFHEYVRIKGRPYRRKYIFKETTYKEALLVSEKDELAYANYAR